MEEKDTFSIEINISSVAADYRDRRKLVVYAEPVELAHFLEEFERLVEAKFKVK